MAFLLSLLFSASCVMPSGTRDTRPSISISPWQEYEIHSIRTATTYTYMHLDGPSPEAPLLLMLHGGIFDNRIFLYCTELAQRYTIVAPLFPDDSPLYTGTIEDWGEVVTDFVTALKRTPSMLLGVSNGAYAALAYMDTEHRPEIDGLVIVSAILFGISREEVRKRTRMARRAMMLKPERLRGLIERKSLQTAYNVPPGPVSQTDIFHLRPYPYYRQLFTGPRDRGDRQQDTRSIDIPTLILHGTRDDIMPIRAARKTPQAFPRASFVALEGLGHDMIFSHGFEISRMILAYFDP